MKQLKHIVLGILNLLIRLSIACLVVMYVYRFAMASYHFGYMIFTDSSKDLAPGRDITVSVEMEDSAFDIGKTLQKRGVIDDAKLFFVQEYLSEYHKELKPGVYTLNSSMRPSEILAILANADITYEEEENSSQVSSTINENVSDASDDHMQESETGMTDASNGENSDGDSSDGDASDTAVSEENN